MLCQAARRAARRPWRSFAAARGATATSSGTTSPSALQLPPEAPPSQQPLLAGPLAVYTHGVNTGKYRADAQQLDAIKLLQRVWDECRDRAAPVAGTGLTLVDPAPSSSTWSLWDVIARKLEPPPALGPPTRGLYLYGGVGSGKTMLMDLFYDALPPGVHKKRIHFHDFMLSVHRRLRLLKNVADPLEAVAEEFTRKDKPGGGHLVLCLDEFMVTDVADAMILKRLFQHLFNCGLVMVSTSNRAPDRLYEGGLQRPLFVPFIELLKTQCEVHDIQGAQDYRRLARKLAQSLYFTGPDASAELQCCFGLFAPGLKAAPVDVSVMMGRVLHVPRAAGRVAYFSFAQLLEQPVAAADFIALCERFHTILLDGVPCLVASTRAAAYRLVTLVDVAYEQRARLIVAAAAPPAAVFEKLVTQAEFRDAKASLPAAKVEELCVDDNVGFAKERTVSRLVEMQSIQYAREHAAKRAPELLPSLPPETNAVV